MTSTDHMPQAAAQTEITRLLKDWSAGSDRARARLMPLVYDILHKLAASQFSGERADHTLQPTALVNEAFLSLEDSDVDWQDRHHFFAYAARTMRHILVDHARARARDKRGGGQRHVGLTLAAPAVDAPSAELLALDQALTRLAAFSQRTAEILELVYFGGLKRDAVARLLGISSRTVDRDLTMGRAWLRQQITSEQP